jgi:hypothetical protein
MNKMLAVKSIPLERPFASITGNPMQSPSGNHQGRLSDQTNAAASERQDTPTADIMAAARWLEKKELESGDGQL